MLRVRVAALALSLVALFAWNVSFAPRIMTDREPIFNGPDIASNWEWRSMAIDMHSWWLWKYFPDAQVRNVGFLPPAGQPDALRVGIQFSSWIDQSLGLNVDTSQPPLDATNLDIRDELSANAKNWSRIHCRDNQEMVVRDTCYFLVSWNWGLLPDSEPEFFAVRTTLSDDSEIALVERNFLEDLIGRPAESLPDFHDVDSP